MSNYKYSHSHLFLCDGSCIPASKLSSHLSAHVVGELRQVMDEGTRVTGLSLFESSIPAASWDSASQHPVRMVIIGDARQIRCTVCGKQIRWEIGKAAFDALTQRQQRGRGVFRTQSQMHGPAPTPDVSEVMHA